MVKYCQERLTSPNGRHPAVHRVHPRLLFSCRRIRELRGFDMTQEEFAERIGISQNYLSMMERGKVEIWGGDPASNQSGVCE